MAITGCHACNAMRSIAGTVIRFARKEWFWGFAYEQVPNNIAQQIIEGKKK